MSISKSLDYSELFMLEDPLSNRPLRLESQQEWVNIETQILLVDGKWQPPEPIVYKAVMGGRITDFLWTTGPSVCVSERAVELLRENRFTGWATYPVEVYGRHGEVLPEYYGFAITSYAGKQNISRSKVITKPPLSPALKPDEVYKGFYFDENKWDGSDFFRVTDAFKIVTSRVQEAFKQAKITNVYFTPLPDIEIPTIIFKIGRKNQDNIS